MVFGAPIALVLRGAIIARNAHAVVRSTPGEGEGVAPVVAMGLLAAASIVSGVIGSRGWRLGVATVRRSADAPAARREWIKAAGSAVGVGVLLAVLLVSVTASVRRDRRASAAYQAFQEAERLNATARKTLVR